jgi:hypothetical protein
MNFNNLKICMLSKLQYIQYTSFSPRFKRPTQRWRSSMMGYKDEGWATGARGERWAALSALSVVCLDSAMKTDVF